MMIKCAKENQVSKIYKDYSRYVKLCKQLNLVPWNMSDERNFYKHYTYVRKRNQANKGV